MPVRSEVSSAGLVVTGAVIVGGLLLVSVLLYLLDTWATARIDDMLRSHSHTKTVDASSQYTYLHIIMCLYSIFRSHYGDTLYSKMTSEFDPEGVAALSNRLGMCLVS